MINFNERGALIKEAASKMEKKTSSNACSNLEFQSVVHSKMQLSG